MKNYVKNRIWAEIVELLCSYAEEQSTYFAENLKSTRESAEENPGDEWYLSRIEEHEFRIECMERLQEILCSAKR